MWWRGDTPIKGGVAERIGCTRLDIHQLPLIYFLKCHFLFVHIKMGILGSKSEATKGKL
jgi:hypothetical protein